MNEKSVLSGIHSGIQLPNNTSMRLSRRKLWELPGSCHCLIVGTCLTLAEVKAIGKKCKYEVAGKTDYELHRFFVGQASYSDSVIAQKTQKLLEKKFRVDIHQFKAVRIEQDLMTQWQQFKALGRVAGSVWAVVTHPMCSSELIEAIYGEVHMLSHLSGASTHKNAVRLPAVRRELESLQKKLATRRKAAFRKFSAYQEKVQRLEDQLASERENTVAIASKIPERDGEAIQSDRIREVSLLLADKKHQLQKTSQLAEFQQKKLDQQQQNIAELEQLVNYLVRSDNASTIECDKSLSGKCVLLLGGMPSQCKHFKAFVESNDGKFLHHDGGMESSYSQIDQLVSRADAVFCPVEKVSHSAMKRARKLCKKSEKPLVFLPKSSLSAFVTSMRTIQ